MKTGHHFNIKRDTIVSERKTYTSDARKYYGAFENHGTSWLYHTPAGYIDLVKRKHYYYARDYQGSTRAVYTAYEGPTPGLGGLNSASTTGVQPLVDVTPITYQVEQRMAYFPSGMPVNIYTGPAVTDRLHLGKPWINLDGVGLYDNSARLHDAITCTFTTPDPLAYKFTSISPYSNTPGNPVNLADYDGQKANLNVMMQSDNNYPESKRFMPKLYEDLDLITGLEMSLENGCLSYAKEGKEAKVRKIINSEGQLVDAGSKTARDFMIHVIGESLEIIVENGRTCTYKDSEKKLV
ncbi:MAG: hypothetical protein K2M19_08290 [Muribaculaceae bacterium]|nr:hypothetical protein [Muribaculaceae bacterium]